MSLLQVRDLTVGYEMEYGSLLAVSNVSFTLERGESLGLVGESGCGKSTLGAALMRLLPPNGRIHSGSVVLDGVDLLAVSDAEVRRQRWSRIAMIFQSSMSALNPVLRVRHIFEEVLEQRSSLTRPQRRAKIEELFDMVGLPASRIDSYPHELSGGMKQRVIIALSLLCEPDMVIADEPTTALDTLVQERIMQRLQELKRTLGFSMVIVSHDIGLVYQNCTRIAVMYAGQIVEVGSRDEVVRRPQHPYTVSLLASLPSLDGPRRELKSLPGSPPSLVAPPTGCRFHPRCPIAEDICVIEEPTTSGLNLARCHFPGRFENGSAGGASVTDSG